MKKYNKYLFVEDVIKGAVDASVSDGYITGRKGDKIKLPHNNYTLLGIVDECINSSYAEEFSKDIVYYYSGNGEGYGGYCNYMVDAWVYHLQTAVESMKTLIEKLDLKPTDYILRDDTENN